VAPIEESLAAVDEVIRAGKVRHFAISNFGAWQSLEILHLCDANGWSRPVAGLCCARAPTPPARKASITRTPAGWHGSARVGAFASSLAQDIIRLAGPLAFRCAWFALLPKLTQDTFDSLLSRHGQP
jgi:hypothetical protein